MERGFGENAALEAEALGLDQAPLEVGDGAQLAGESDFAQSDEIARDRPVLVGGDDRQGERQVSGGLGDAEAADDAADDVEAGQRQVETAAENG
jgi:hypothetical protein